MVFVWTRKELRRGDETGSDVLRATGEMWPDIWATPRAQMWSGPWFHSRWSFLNDVVIAQVHAGRRWTLGFIQIDVTQSNDSKLKTRRSWWLMVMESHRTQLHYHRSASGGNQRRPWGQTASSRPWVCHSLALWLRLLYLHCLSCFICKTAIIINSAVSLACC